MTDETTRAGGKGYGPSGRPGMSAGYEAPPDPEGRTLGDYFAVLWRYKWIILLVVVVVPVSAYYFSDRQTRIYEATASLIYETQLNVANPLTGDTYTNPDERSIELSSVNSLLASTELGDVARAKLAEKGYGGAAGAASVSADPVKTAANVGNILLITARGTSPEIVAATANAYSDAFVEWRKERVLTQIDSAIEVIKQKLAGYKGKAKDSTDYIVLQQRLQDLEILKGTATGNYRVLLPASAPLSPVAPRPMRSAVLGFGMGLFAAIGLAFLLDQRDTRLRRAEDVAAVLHQPVLGRIPRISSKLLEAGALLTLSQPHGPFAESFRILRTNLDMMVDDDVRSIAVTSCVKGEGKSVVVANLAVSLALSGTRVIVVDADLRAPRQHAYFGLENQAGLSTVIAGKHHLRDAIQPVTLALRRGEPGHADPVVVNGAGDEGEQSSRLHVLTSGPIPGNPGEIVSSKRFETLMRALEREADVVLIDTPAILPVGDASSIATEVDGLVFLADLRVVRLQELRTAADQLLRLPAEPLGVIVRLQHESGSRYYYSPSDYDGPRQPARGGRGKRRRSGTVAGM